VIASHAGLLEAMGVSEAALVLVTVEDLWAETEPQNVPGTPSDRPNWVQRLRHPVDALPQLEAANEALVRLAAARMGELQP
jgi:4-alpha-glucanotransferase